MSEEEEEVKDAVEEGELSDDSEYDSANNVAEGEELTFDFVDAGPGEEFMAVKPWIGAMKEPSSHSPADVDSSPPDEALELSYAFGYRCRGVFDNVHFSAAGTCGNAGRARVRCALLLRTNLRPRGLVVFWCRAGELVYPAAAIGVIANPEDGSQRFYQGHVDDIMCLAVDSTGTLAATGACSPAAVRRAPLTMLVAHRWKGLHRLTWPPRASCRAHLGHRDGRGRGRHQGYPEAPGHGARVLTRFQVGPRRHGCRVPDRGVSLCFAVSGNWSRWARTTTTPWLPSAWPLGSSLGRWLLARTLCSP